MSSTFRDSVHNLQQVMGPGAHPAQDNEYAMGCFQKSEGGRRWCLDSGATSHMCSSKENFETFKRTTGNELHMANANSTAIHGIGKVRVGNNTFKDTLLVPELRMNLGPNYEPSILVLKLEDRPSFT